MKDSEVVRNGIECCRKGFCCFCPYNDGKKDTVECKQKLAFVTIMLIARLQARVDELEEQAAVEPQLDVDEWRCGNCGHKLEHQELLGDNVLFHEQYNYCPNCGKAVKWE